MRPRLGTEARLIEVTGDTREAFTPEQWAYLERRLEKRRAQWREAKWRAKQTDVRPDPVGWFHSLGCSGNGHRRKPSCIPIPAYSKKAVA
jgi:hypothetical protein